MTKGDKEYFIEKGINEFPFKPGKCEYCGTIFQRPHKFKTEIESSHLKDCELKSIKEQIKQIKQGDLWNIYELIDSLESISKTSSFGASPGNRHYERMLECEKLIKELEDSPTTVEVKLK